EAAGFDVMIVETVGVGQSETAVASMVDFFLVLMIAGAGDELQGMKKGVLELADAIAINKADGDNVKRAERARKEYENALHYLRPATPTWTPPVLTCSAKDENRRGIRKIWETVLDHRRRLEKTSELEEKRRRQAVDWMWDLISEGLQDRFRTNPAVRRRLSALQQAVEKGATAPTAAAAELLFLLDKENPV
ncbi:MAG: methylmalonyl Co-A mutase-associated GTPase MeaB, partial [Desulfobacterales bacterium]